MAGKVVSQQPLTPLSPVVIDRRGAMQLAAVLPFALAAVAARAQDALGDIMAPVSSTYASLTSYSDSGIVDVRYQFPGGPLIVERHRFETAFRAPRNFFFRFDEDPAAGGDALVIWCDGGDFQSWWKATGVHEVLDGGRGAVAFMTAQSPTLDAANLVAPHLFPQAQLPGPTIRLIEPRDAGEDAINGRPSRKIVADRREDGVQTVDDRPTTVWTDRESGLIVQVLVDTEPGNPAGFIDQKTFRLDPEANPDLPDERFTFAPPEFP